MGWLADTMDRQRLLLACGVLYALGGTSGLWVDSFVAMLVGRVVLGLGVAGTMILATAWAADLWQGPARERYLGLQGAAMSGGGIVVILLGGMLAALHWRGAFATYLLVGPVVALAWIALAPYAHARTEARREAGATTGAPAAFPWSAFAFVGPLGFLFMTVFYLIPTRGPFLLQNLGVESPIAVGGIMALMTLTSIPGAIGYGRIRQRLGMMAIFALGWTVMGLGMGIIAFAPSAAVAALGVAVMGLGMGPSMPNYTTYWMATVPPALRGRAAGSLTTAFFAGQFASPLVTAPLVSAFGLAGTFEALALFQLVLGPGCGCFRAARYERRQPEPSGRAASLVA